MKKIFNEFKAFISRGNVIDLAVGVIIGGAFSKIVSSLTADVLMPFISLLVGRINISDLNITLHSKAEAAPPVVIQYGVFLQNILDFFLIAICIFIIVKIINRFKETILRTEAMDAVAAKPTETEKLLTQIRDILKERSTETAETEENNQR